MILGMSSLETRIDDFISAISFPPISNGIVRPAPNTWDLNRNGLNLLPVLNPESYDRAQVLEVLGRPMLVIGRSLSRRKMHVVSHFPPATDYMK